MEVKTKKEVTEEPALHGDRLNHTVNPFGKSRVSNVTRARRSATNPLHKAGKVRVVIFEPLTPPQEPGAAREALSDGVLPAQEIDEDADRYGDVALGVESAWPTGMVAR
jgi:hypothetical protein